jgi:hypothetical protein
LEQQKPIYATAVAGQIFHFLKKHILLLNKQQITQDFQFPERHGIIVNQQAI